MKNSKKYYKKKFRGKKKFVKRKAFKKFKRKVIKAMESGAEHYFKKTIINPSPEDNPNGGWTGSHGERPGWQTSAMYFPSNVDRGLAGAQYYEQLSFTNTQDQQTYQNQNQPAYSFLKGSECKWGKMQIRIKCELETIDLTGGNWYPQLLMDINTNYSRYTFPCTIGLFKAAKGVTDPDAGTYLLEITDPMYMLPFNNSIVKTIKRKDFRLDYYHPSIDIRWKAVRKMKKIRFEQNTDGSGDLDFGELRQGKYFLWMQLYGWSGQGGDAVDFQVVPRGYVNEVFVDIG